MRAISVRDAAVPAMQRSGVRDAAICLILRDAMQRCLDAMQRCASVTLSACHSDAVLSVNTMICDAASVMPIWRL
jgi:hypothetical protein